jgi:hypothetical protein
MKKAFIFAAGILLALSAFAADILIARDGNNTLTLSDTPCGQKVARLLPAEHASRFRGAIDRSNGNVFQACWMLQGPDQVFLIYDDGDMARVPMREFKRIGSHEKPAKGSV